MPARLHAIFKRLTAVLEPSDARTVRSATSDEIWLTGVALGLPLPPELGAWLALCNGCELPDGQCILGTRRPLSIVAGSSSALRERQLLPIAHDGCGDRWCILLTHPSRPIVFIDQNDPDSSGNYLAASGLPTFLDMFIREYETGDDPPWFDPAALRAADPAAQPVEGFHFAWSG